MREFEHEIVERLGRDAGLHHRHEKIQRFSGQPARTPHTLEGLGPVELDLAGLATSALRSFDERHQVIRIAPSKPDHMGQTGAPRKVHECRDTFAQCSFNHYHRGRDWLSGPLQGTRPRIMSEPDDLMTALDPTSFGAYRPTGWAETLISYTRSMPRNWAGRRLAFALRQIAIWMLRGEPLDVETLGAKMRLYPYNNVCEKRLRVHAAVFRSGRARVPLAAIHEGFVFVDVGANVGGYSLFVAARAGSPAGSSPSSRSRTSSSALSTISGRIRFGTVKALDCAVADKTGDVTLVHRHEEPWRIEREVHRPWQGPLDPGAREDSCRSFCRTRASSVWTPSSSMSKARKT